MLKCGREGIVALLADRIESSGRGLGLLARGFQLLLPLLFLSLLSMPNTLSTDVMNTQLLNSSLHPSASQLTLLGLLPASSIRNRAKGDMQHSFQC